MHLGDWIDAPSLSSGPSQDGCQAQTWIRIALSARGGVGKNGPRADGGQKTLWEERPESGGRDQESDKGRRRGDGGSQWATTRHTIPGRSAHGLGRFWPVSSERGSVASAGQCPIGRE